MRFIAECQCKHDAGFKILRNSAADRAPYSFYCEHLCGFSMNFSPDEAGKYRGFRWRKLIVMYNNRPDPNREWKDPPKMAPPPIG